MRGRTGFDGSVWLQQGAGRACLPARQRGGKL